MARNRLRKRKWFVANQRAKKEGPPHELPDAAPRLELWVWASRARCAHAPGVRPLASARARGRTAVFGRTVGCPLLAGVCVAPASALPVRPYPVALRYSSAASAPGRPRSADGERCRSRPEAAGAGPRVRGRRASGKPRVCACARVHVRADTPACPQCPCAPRRPHARSVTSCVCPETAPEGWVAGGSSQATPSDLGWTRPAGRQPRPAGQPPLEEFQVGRFP